MCTLPMPVQVGHAPAGLLNEKCAMPNSGTSAPHDGHGYRLPVSSSSASSSGLMSNVGGISAPHRGHGRWPMRANRTRRYVKTSVAVPTVERGLRLVRC